MMAYQAPHKLEKTRIVMYGFAKEFHFPETPGLNAYSGWPVFAMRMMVGKDFCGTISHPDDRKDLSPEVNEIISAILLPRYSEKLKSYGQYVGYMKRTHNIDSEKIDEFLDFDEKGNALFKRKISKAPEKTLIKFLDPEFWFRNAPESVVVPPTFQEIDFEFREPGQEIDLENLLLIPN